MIEAHGYDLPLAVPYRWAKGVQTRRRGAVVRIALADGAEGFGEAAPPPHEDTDGALLAGAVLDFCAGLDPEAPDFLARLDSAAPPARLRCAISTAWHGAMAMRAGQSLARYLSTEAAPEVPVNGLVTEAAPADAAARAAALFADGMTTLKIKCTADRAENLARVAAIRAAAPGAVLRLDPNEALDMGDAAAHLDALAAFGIEYCEQPVPQHDPETLARLSGTTRVPIAADEAAKDMAAVTALIDARAVRFLILKPQRLGGPDRLLAIARTAHAAGIACTITNSIETAVGLTAALHMAAALGQVPACGLATARFYAEDLAEAPAIRHGRMTVPTEPGLGVRPRFPFAPSR